MRLLKVLNQTGSQARDRSSCVAGFLNGTLLCAVEDPRFVHSLCNLVSGRNRSVGITSGLRAGRARDGGSISDRDKMFIQGIFTGCGTYPASLSVGTGFLPWIKRPGLYLDKFRNEWRFISTFSRVFKWRVQGQLYLYLMFTPGVYKQ